MTHFTEGELIEALRKILSGDAPGVRLGPGDDAALVEMGGRLEVLTADMLVEDVDFHRATIAPRDLGYRALAVNISDVAAMGGSPRYALASIGLPQDIELAWVIELYGGMREAADEYALALVGGDTSSAGRIVLSVAVTGEVAEGRAVTRSGARPGDRIVVTGSFGAAAGGLMLSEARPGEVGGAVISDWGRELLRALARPVARVGEGQSLAAAGATSMVDVSDGLARDLSHICEESEVGAAIRLADVPVAPALYRLLEVMDVDPVELALHGGEDFELLATVPPGSVGAATAALADRFGTPLTDVGEVRPDGGLVAVDREGSERPLSAEGWDHFAR